MLWDQALLWVSADESPSPSSSPAASAVFREFCGGLRPCEACPGGAGAGLTARGPLGRGSCPKLLVPPLPANALPSPVLVVVLVEVEGVAGLVCGSEESGKWGKQTNKQTNKQIKTQQKTNKNKTTHTHNNNRKKKKNKKKKKKKKKKMKQTNKQPKTKNKTKIEACSPHVKLFYRENWLVIN